MGFFVDLSDYGTGYFRLFRDGEEERGDRQYLRCFRILWRDRLSESKHNNPHPNTASI